MRKQQRKTGHPRRRSAAILDAAAEVFASRGFHGASTQDIADVLGIRQASLYYYFPSKEVALEEVCLRGVEGFLETAISIAAAAGSAHDKIARLIAAHLAPGSICRPKAAGASDGCRAPMSGSSKTC